jgi:hypothetical protein
MGKIPAMFDYQRLYENLEPSHERSNSQVVKSGD